VRSFAKDPQEQPCPLHRVSLNKRTVAPKHVIPQLNKQTEDRKPRTEARAVRPHPRRSSREITGLTAQMCGGNQGQQL
jgi:hypothetical protein